MKPSDISNHGDASQEKGTENLSSIPVSFAYTLLRQTQNVLQMEHDAAFSHQEAADERRKMLNAINDALRNFSAAETSCDCDWPLLGNCTHSNQALAVAADSEDILGWILNSAIASARHGDSVVLLGTKPEDGRRYAAVTLASPNKENNND